MRNISTTVRGHYDDDRYMWAIIIRRFCDTSLPPAPVRAAPAHGAAQPVRARRAGGPLPFPLPLNRRRRGAAVSSAPLSRTVAVRRETTTPVSILDHHSSGSRQWHTSHAYEPLNRIATASPAAQQVRSSILSPQPPLPFCVPILWVSHKLWRVQTWCALILFHDFGQEK
jgi:hypothetical protein